MAYTLQQLTDIEEIKLLKHRYFRGMDTANWDLLGTLFANEVTVDFRGGGYRVNFTGRDNFLTFLKNSFHSDAVAMHYGSMPEITLTGDDEAEGYWYLYDIFIQADTRSQTTGTALYKDRYRRINGEWKIVATEYDRLIEIVGPMDSQTQITVQYLATRGLKPEEREDIRHLIKFDGGHG